MDQNADIFPAYRLVAQFADGQRLTFDGLTDQQAQTRMEAAQALHGDICWYDGPAADDQHDRPDGLPRKGGMTVPIRESKRRNNDAYNAKCDYISLRPQKAVGYAIRAAAKATGQSIQAYVLQACTERMTREGQPLTLDPPADNK